MSYNSAYLRTAKLKHLSKLRAQGRAGTRNWQTANQIDFRRANPTTMISPLSLVKLSAQEHYVTQARQKLPLRPFDFEAKSLSTPKAQ